MCGMDKHYQVDSYCELIHPLEGMEVLSEYAEDFYAGMAASTKHVFGKGCCYYLAARFEQAYLNELYRDILKEKGMTGLFRDAAPGIDVSVRSNGTEDYLFLLNFSGKEACVTFEEAAGDSDLCARASGKEKYTDIATKAAGKQEYVDNAAKVAEKQEYADDAGKATGKQEYTDFFTGEPVQGRISLPENGYRIFVMHNDKQNICGADKK